MANDVRLAQIPAQAQCLQTWTWSKLFDPSTDNLRTDTGGGLADNSLYGGIYLGALVDGWRATGDESLCGAMQRIFAGLVRNASDSGVPGYIYRGIRGDGTHDPRDPSIDQYTGLLYGMWRYLDSRLASTRERDQARTVFDQVLHWLYDAPPGLRWRVRTAPGDAVTTWGYIDAWRPGSCVLFLLGAGAQVTGDPRWQQLYDEERTLRLPCAHDWLPTMAWMMDSWVAIQVALVLHALMSLDAGPSRPFHAALDRLARRCRRQWPEIDAVPTATAAAADLDAAYRDNSLFTRRIRNPVEALVVDLLSPDCALAPATDALLRINERLIVERAERSVLAVPWLWCQWLWLARNP